MNRLAPHAFADDPTHTWPVVTAEQLAAVKATIWETGHTAWGDCIEYFQVDAPNRESSVFAYELNDGRILLHPALAREIGVEPPPKPEPPRAEDGWRLIVPVTFDVRFIRNPKP